MNELLGWYGYCNNNADHAAEQFNSLTKSRITTVLSQSTSYSNMNQSSGTGNRNRDNRLSLDENTTDSMSIVDEMAKITCPKNGIVITTTGGGGETTVSAEKSPPRPHPGSLISTYSFRDEIIFKRNFTQNIEYSKIIRIFPIERTIQLL